MKHGSAEVERNAPRPLALLIVVAGLVTAWRLFELFTDPFNLSFDEAQYWAWAQDLTFGYFSKPPMVAWSIWLTTAVGGDGEAWVRLGATVSHLLTAIAVFLAGRAIISEKAGLWAGILYVTLPGVALSAMVITTDAFLLLFWALALHAYAVALRTRSLHWWLLLGLWLGLGLLSKYAMAFFAAAVALHLVLSPPDRPVLRTAGPWLAAALGFLIYLPNLMWNAANGFASYKHTQENANLQANLFNPGEFLEFIGSQFGVFGPLLFATLLVIVFVRFLPAVRDPRWRLLLSFVVPILGFYFALSFVSRANANWAATAYIAGTILVAGWLLERPRWKWVIGVSIVIHVLAATALYNMEAAARLVGTELTARTDLLKRVRGWDEVGEWVRLLTAEHADAQLLFDDRKTMANLLYYARPQAFQAVMWNPDGGIQNHYELTTSLEGREGDDFLFVTRGTADHLQPYFKSVGPPDILRLSIHPRYTLAVRAYRATGFKGYDSK